MDGSFFVIHRETQRSKSRNEKDANPMKMGREKVLSEFENNMELQYAGDITAQEAWELLESDKNAQLVDVRTVPEWVFVGYPDLSSLNKSLLRISWRMYPQMLPNDEFERQLSEEVEDKDAPLLFLCRSGGRSLDAAIAMTTKGYSKCYNIVGGFEGDLDEGNHRGFKSGWKATNLPWEQS